MDRPDDPTPELDSSRATLNLLVKIGFWLAAGSLVVGFPLCLGCAVFLPEHVAPFAFLGVPVLFLVGVILCVGGSIVVERAFQCLECRDWIVDGTRLAELRQCPRCGRWGRPEGGSAERPPYAGHGFPVIVKEHREPGKPH